jgi:hypothetical protein
MCDEAKNIAMKPTMLLTSSRPAMRYSFKASSFSTIQNLAESVNNSAVGRLGLVLSVEEEAVLLLAPRVLVRDTPDSDTDTLGDVKASLGNSSVVGSRGSTDVELSDSNLLDTSGSHLLESSLDTVGGTRVEMGLRTNTVNGDALGNPLLDVGDHTSLELGGVGIVNAVVVDVQLGVGVSGAGSAEGNANELLTQNLGERRVLAESTIPVEDLVEDVLFLLEQMHIERW